MSELLSCPFCGSKARAITSDMIGCSGDQKCALGHYLVLRDKWQQRASAPVEAGTAALDDLLDHAPHIKCEDTEGGRYFTEQEVTQARIELERLKRAAAGRDAVLEECAAICDRAAREWPREPASANDAAFRIRAMQSPPATGEVKP